MDNDKVIAAFGKWGCNTDVALERMLYDKELFVSLALQYKDSMETDELIRAINCRNINNAFDIAHNMKGLLGNFGFDPLYKIMCEIVTILRSGTVDGVMPLLDVFTTKKSELDALLM